MDPVAVLLIVLVILVLGGAAWLVVSRRPPSQAPTAPAPSTPGHDLSTGINKTSRALGGALRGVFGRPRIDQAFWDAMEEALISADVGAAVATDIVAEVRGENPPGPSEARTGLHRQLASELAGRHRRLELGESKPAIVLVVGVNGTGKTTTIAKLARRLLDEGSQPLLGAADTFRAGADAQLRTWGERLSLDVVGGQEGADPAAVAFDAFAAARARGRDVVLVDTAGRLQAKHNLMAELTKIKRVLEREAGTVDEVLLVLDATGGQNGIAQVEEFTSAVNVTGIVLTKLDGTARGGIVLAVERRLGVPVKFVGVGETVEDLVAFDPDEFVDALLADA